MSIKPNYRNAKYIKQEGWIDCEIEHPDYGWIPYTIDPNDSDTMVDNEYLLSVITDAAPYEPPSQEEVDAENAMKIRDDRSVKLQNEVDPIVSNPLRWNDLTEAEQTEVTTYRQSLLDITAQETFPNSVTWPTKPSILDQIKVIKMINWKILNMKRNTSDGGVFLVDWEVTKTETADGVQYVAVICGGTKFEPDASDSSFTSFDNLTEEQVVSWVKESDAVDVTQIEVDLSADITRQQTPPTATGTPW